MDINSKLNIFYTRENKNSHEKVLALLVINLDFFIVLDRNELIPTGIE